MQTVVVPCTRLSAVQIRKQKAVNTIELTILMPSLNEARTLSTCIGKARAFLERRGIHGEVLIADNGSTDGSQRVAIDAGARVINAQGRFVVMGDSDDSYDFSKLDLFVERLRQGHQLVMGDRFAGGIQPGAMPPLHRYLGNPVLSYLGRLLFSSPIRDFHCGLRGFDRDAIKTLHLQSSGMEFASEMIVKATLDGLRIAEVPTTLRPDGRNRPPHLRSWRDGWRHLRFLLLHAPTWLFLIPGALLLCVGAATTAAIAIGPIVFSWFTLDINSMLYSAVAACLGLQMLMLAGAASVHGCRIGILPKIPRGLGWAKNTSLESFLQAGLAIFLCGVALAAYSVFLWSRANFNATDPQVLMRVSIPAAALMLCGCQVMATGFLMEFIRLTPRRRASDFAVQADFLVTQQ
jgi:glycosyltransferase involved in cell wall biosynthesis